MLDGRRTSNARSLALLNWTVSLTIIWTQTDYGTQRIYIYWTITHFYLSSHLSVKLICRRLYISWFSYQFRADWCNASARQFPSKNWFVLRIRNASSTFNTRNKKFHFLPLNILVFSISSPVQHVINAYTCAPVHAVELHVHERHLQCITRTSSSARSTTICWILCRNRRTRRICSRSKLTALKPNACLPTQLNSTQLAVELSWVELSWVESCRYRHAFGISHRIVKTWAVEKWAIKAELLMMMMMMMMILTIWKVTLPGDGGIIN